MKNKNDKTVKLEEGSRIDSLTPYLFDDPIKPQFSIDTSFVLDMNNKGTEKITAEALESYINYKIDLKLSSYTQSLIGTIIHNMNDLLLIPYWADRLLIADGRSVLKSDYVDLYGVIGDIFGSDTDSFNLPNLIDKVLYGGNTEPSVIISQIGEHEHIVSDFTPSALPHNHGMDHQHGYLTHGNDSGPQGSGGNAFWGDKAGETTGGRDTTGDTTVKFNLIAGIKTKPFNAEKSTLVDGVKTFCYIIAK